MAPVSVSVPVPLLTRLMFAPPAAWPVVAVVVFKPIAPPKESRVVVLTVRVDGDAPEFVTNTPKPLTVPFMPATVWL